MEKMLRDMALAYHRNPRPGKTEVIPTKPYDSPADLALAYSPGVAYPCLEIKDDENKVSKTLIQNLAKEKYNDLAGLAQQYLFYWKRDA